MIHRRPLILIGTDLALALCFAALAATGAILRWVLPPGSGGRAGGHAPHKQLLDLTRHEWGQVHFIVAATMLVLVIVHLAMHWGWIKACARRAVGRPAPAA